MMTIEQTTIGLRSHDNKRNWIRSINLIHMDIMINASGDDAVVERIIENCAHRVKISATAMK